MPRSSVDIECLHTLGGISVATIDAYGFDVPYVDIRYCKDCHAYYKITIQTAESAPQIDLIGREVVLPWIEMHKAFPIIKITGRRITRK
jgi:hypothetical protein